MAGSGRRHIIRGETVIAKTETDIEIRSGPTVTADGLAFTALQDSWVVAYNDETLEELWRFNLGTALNDVRGATTAHLCTG